MTFSESYCLGENISVSKFFLTNATVNCPCYKLCRKKENIEVYVINVGFISTNEKEV